MSRIAKSIEEMECMVAWRLGGNGEWWLMNTGFLFEMAKIDLKFILMVAQL